MTAIMIIGEAYGAEEEETGLPFVGPSGRLLKGLLAQSGIKFSECVVTNVFNLRPQPTNDISNLCGPKSEGIAGYPALAQSRYVRREFQPELDRLYREIDAADPALILALGGTALWALTRVAGIRKSRGAPLLSDGTLPLARQYKILPTYHPAAVMREWTLRPIILADLNKAVRESQFPEFRRPERFIWVEPDLADIKQFYEEFIVPSPDLSVDIETAGEQITCVGFAPRDDLALVIPFVSNTLGSDGNYWKTFSEERQAWRWVRFLCGLPKTYVGQNFLYDMHRLFRTYGIPVPGAGDDTMLLHHALQPEMEKGLGFLGSIYTEEPSWKFMRAKHETLKQED